MLKARFHLKIKYQLINNYLGIKIENSSKQKISIQDQPQILRQLNGVLSIKKRTKSNLFYHLYLSQMIIHLKNLVLFCFILFVKMLFLKFCV